MAVLNSAFEANNDFRARRHHRPWRGGLLDGEAVADDLDAQTGLASLLEGFPDRFTRERRYGNTRTRIVEDGVPGHRLRGNLELQPSTFWGLGNGAWWLRGRRLARNATHRR